MATYFKITNSGMTMADVLEIEELAIEREAGAYVTQAASETSEKPFHVLASIVDPAYDPTTQVREGPVDTWDGVNAVRTYSVRDKTQQEITDGQQTIDIEELKDRVDDAVLILMQLAQWTLANTSMVAADFSPKVQSVYTELKTNSDRLA